MSIKMPEISAEGLLLTPGIRETKRFIPQTPGGGSALVPYEKIRVGECFILDGIEMRKLGGGARRKMGGPPKQLMQISDSCLVGRGLKVTVIG